MDEGRTTVLSPALSHIIERPRLIKLLEEPGARVILLAAPAGYGKTTLARQWAERQSGRVAWYRTTHASGDVAALAVGLDETLAEIAPELPRDPRRIASIASVNPRPAPLARALVSTYKGLGSDVLLILDEWEAAGTVEADELVGTLVDELAIRFLVTSRVRSPWFEPRREVYGEGLEIGLDELTMTDQEAQEVVSRHLEAEEAATLLATAGGWPAALGIVAMTAAKTLPGGPLLPRALYDFLARDLLDAAPPNVQEALILLAAASATELETSELLFGSNAPELMSDAVARGLIRIDGERSISIHPLLKTTLLERAAAFPPARRFAVIDQLRVLIAARRWDEALSVAATLPDRRYVSDALRRALDDLLQRGRVETLRRWVLAGRQVEVDEGLVDYVESEVFLRVGESEAALLYASRAARRLEDDLAARAHIVAARAANFAGRPRQFHDHAQAARALSRASETRSIALWMSFLDAVEEERADYREIFEELDATPVDSADQAVRCAQGSMTLGFLEGSLEARLDDGEAALTLLEAVRDPLTQTSFLNKYADALTACAYYERSLAVLMRAEWPGPRGGRHFRPLL